MTNSIISTEIKRLLNLLEEQREENEIIEWGSPIPFFGKISKSEIATVGINPSNNEFVDKNGLELLNENRRFQTLFSINAQNWREINDSDLEKIELSLRTYFNNNPYNRWFGKLDFLFSGSNHSYYFPFENIAHIDLVPFATVNKWGKLDKKVQNNLLNISIDSIGRIIKHTPVRLMILNGQAVVRQLLNISDVELVKKHEPLWDLKRGRINDVKGYSYYGKLSTLGGIQLEKKILVLGFNHNLQSSFGVTKEVHNEIKNWIQKMTTNAN